MSPPTPWVRRRLTGARVITLAAVMWSFGATGPRVALAQNDEPDPSAELFREGRQLLNDGRFQQACEMFRESLALRRSPGTLLNVGNCLEFEGQLIEALDVFSEARALAAAEPDARKSSVWTLAAEDEIAAIERRIASVTISAAEPAPRVTLDGQPLALFGAPVRLNPGRHRVVAHADGKQPFERELELAEGQSELLEIPALAPLPEPEPVDMSPAPLESAAPPPVATARVVTPPPDALPGGETRVWPWVVIGAGAAVFAGGAVTGIVAADMESDLEDQCRDKTCMGEVPALRARGYRTAVAADVLMLTGVVTATVGTVWLLLSDDDSGPAVAGGCSRAGCQAHVSGHF